MKSITPKELAILFHNTYERLAPNYGYETREETKRFDENSPNGKLMIAVCEVIASEYGKRIMAQGEKYLLEFYENIHK